jgi:GAF domain-containing protein
MTASTALETYLAIGPHSAEEHVLRLLIELGAQVVGASEGSLLVYDEPAKELVFALTVGGTENVLAGQRVPLNKGLTGLAAVTREVQIGAPTYREIRQAEGRSLSGDGSPEAVMAAPMLIADSLVGVITAVSFEPGKRFTGTHAELYGRVAAVAGVVVDQKRRLDAITQLGLGERTPEHQIAETLARLTRLAPGALPRVARLLEAIEGLVSASGSP